MGILNVTPDSFSDGGLFFSPEAALRQAENMAEAGADIIDIGGESTRPATFDANDILDPAEELRRILPIIELLTARLPEIPLSVDTYKAEVARKATPGGTSPQKR